MLKMIKNIFRIMTDREASFDYRMFNMVMLSGVLTGILGMFVCMLAHVPLGGILATLTVWVGALLLLFLGNAKPGLISICRYLLLLGLCIILPTIWFTSGGLHSGVNIWFLYGFIFCVFLFNGIEEIISIAIYLVFVVLTYIVSLIFPSMVWVFSNERDIYVSIIGSCLVVGLALVVTFRFYKIIYIEEQRISKRQQASLEAINESQKSFFANISHEIRTPINTIIGLNEMNLREDLSSELQENCENIQSASKMLLSLVNDVLDISKIQSGRMDIIPEKYEFASILSDLVNMIWVRASDKGLEFKMDISKDIPTVMYGDSVRIKQILINLLTNAIKYTEKGTVTLSVNAERLDYRRVVLSMAVTDTGIGIKKEDIKYLFDSFRRVDQEKTKYIEGTGLGLTITSSLVELMGGKITVDSIYQQGTTFTFTLEQEIIDSAPIGVIDTNIRNRNNKKNSKKYEPSFVAPDAKVLVVDDNRFNQIVATKLLSGTEVMVDVASSGKECLDMIMKKHYDVILMDHMMPEMDGIETLKNIRNRRESSCSNVPVIALTANAGNGLEEFYLNQGFQSYIVKPVSGEALEKVLKEFIPKELIFSNDLYEDVENADIEINQDKAYKKKITITADSVCDLPKAAYENFGIRIMPYFVESAELRYKEGIEIWPENIFEFLDKMKGDVKSCPPTVEDYEAFFGGVLGEAEQVIHLCMTSKTSEGYANACKAAESFDNVYIVDSEHLSTGMGMMAIRMMKMVDDHYSVEDILKEIPKLRKRISTSFILTNTEYLYRAKRISGFVNKVSKLFSICPILQLKKGEMKVGKVYGGEPNAAIKKYVKGILKNGKKVDPENIFLTYSGVTLEQRIMVKEVIESIIPAKNIYQVHTSCAISSNCGPGTVGIIFIEKQH